MSNRTSPIRTGFDYQDYWALKLCAEWLADPSKYAWLQFETSPDDHGGALFYLDDIICQTSDSSFEFYQVKHKHDRNAQWTWKELIVPHRRRGTSHIQKWAQSLLPRLAKTKQALFVTDGLASREICVYLENDLVNTAIVREKNPDLYARLKDQVGTDSDVEAFFGKFQFRFSQRGPDELEENTRRFLFRELRATKSGVDNLLLQIHKECRRPNPRRLDIPILREWCEFDTPRPLDEEFEIPSDFEFFDDDAHQEMLHDLQQCAGGVKVVCGRPGVGKSVYLSRLDKDLKDADVMSVKHHYHISPEDNYPQERLNADRVIEALKAQFKDRPEDLGDLANKNSRDIPVSEFVSTAGYCQTIRGKPLVIVIDGLDHVLRYGAKEDLEAFLKEVCRPQPGVWFVFGMQPVAKPHLPRIVYERCPEESWTYVEGLTKDSVDNIVKANAVALNLSEDWRLLRDLLDRLFAITEGNPLHLRYTLQQLKNREKSSLVTEYSCDELIPYGGDMETYYLALWGQLPDVAKTVLLAVASVNFRFSRSQLIECVSSFFDSPAQVTESFGAVAHLITQSQRGMISVYHSSFEVFLGSRPEFGEQRIALKTKVKVWLESSSYDYLKWAELRIIEHELGNNEPLLKIDREWLIQAICRPSNPSQIIRQLTLASQVAFECGDYPTALRISYLQTYYENSKDQIGEVYRQVFGEAIRQSSLTLEYLDVVQLPAETLAAACDVAEETGDVVARKEIIPELIDRSGMQEIRNGQVPPVTVMLLRVLPYDRRHRTDRVVKYMMQFRDLGITPALFGEYCRRLLALGQQNKVEEVLALSPAKDETAAILTEYARHRLLLGTVDLGPTYDRHPDLPAVCVLHGLLEFRRRELPELIRYEDLPEKLVDYDTEARSKWEVTYHEQFLIALAYSLSGRSSVVEEWIEGAPGYWSARAVMGLLRAAQVIGGSPGEIQYTDLFACLAEIEELEWLKDRDRIALQQALKVSISRIIRDLIAVKQYRDENVAIGVDDYIWMTRRPSLFATNDLISLALDSGEQILEQAAYEKLKNVEITRIAGSVATFRERAQDYANLASLGRLQGDSSGVEKLLCKAASNLMGYGDHKDMYLFGVIAAVGLLCKSGVRAALVDEWVERLTPIIDKVEDFTDGDETGHLPLELSDLLAHHNPKMLWRMYHQTAEEEDLHHAQTLFRYVIRSFSFDVDAEIVVASTALDEESLKELKKLSERYPGAKGALEMVTDYLGSVEYTEEGYTSGGGLPEPPYDFGAIAPSQLANHLEAERLDTKYERDRYLCGWTKYWLAREKGREVYEAMQLVNQDDGWKELPGEVLDALYPLAYEHDGDRAFEILCEAQIQDHGWDRYWTEKN